MDDAKRCEKIYKGFHHGAINGMDTCVRKPVVVTCSTDRSIRLWNFIDNTLDLVKYFKDEPLSVALHPSALYLLVGFNESLCLMNILIDDIRPSWQSNFRGSREVRFSNGGQHFASVHAGSIVVHSTWTFEPVAALKGHNGKVRSIYWAADDSRIVSCGIDGLLINWNYRTQKKEFEVNIGGMCMNAILGADLKTVYLLGGDGVMRVRKMWNAENDRC